MTWIQGLTPYLGWSHFVCHNGMSTVIKLVEINAYLAEALLKGINHTWGLGTSSTYGIKWESLWVGITNHFRLFGTLVGFSGVWGWSSVRWLSGLSLVGSLLLGSCYFLCGGVTHPRGSPSLSKGWGDTTCTLIPWRQGFRHSTRNECMGWFAQILLKWARLPWFFVHWLFDLLSPKNQKKEKQKEKKKH